MPRTISFEDAGLFQMVCHMGGISHPPGYPLFTSLCQLFVALPVFSPGVFAGNFLSAIFAALACVVFFSCCMAITRDKFLSYLAALGYGFSATFWSQAIIIEVYSLAVLMFVLCFRVLLLYADSGNIRHLYVAIAIYALALTNHWPLMVLSTPALLAVIYPRTELILTYLRSPFFWSLSLLLCLIGLTPYLMLFFQHEPPIAVFGTVNSVPEFMKYLFRSAYSDQHEIAGVMDRGRYALWLLSESRSQFGWLGVPIILIGIFESFRRRSLSINFSFVLVYFSGTFLLNLLLNFRFDFFWQAIFKPYPVISYLALAFWFAVGVRTSTDWIARRVGSKGQILSPVISVCVLVVILSVNFVRNNRANSTWVEQYGRSVLESLPMNSVFFLRGDFEYGLFGYLHHVMEVRPDIELRSWDNLVFSNRLVSPHEPYDVQQKKRTEFLEKESRPVFAISAGLSPTTQLGGYYRYLSGQPKSVGRNPAMDTFLDYFLDLYLGGYITDPHENYFAFYRIVNFTRQYVGLALKHPGLSEVELRRLERLQLTFPGKLATLETLIGTGLGVAGKEVLLDFADTAEDQIPEFITNESLAVFYEFYGSAHAMEPSDNELAISYYEKSIQELPIQTNTSLCPLIRLYRSEGNQTKLSLVLAHYPSLEC